MKRRTCVIVGDEQRGRTALAALLARNIPEINVAGGAESVDGAVALIEIYKPDIVFLDAGLIGGTVFDVLDRVRGCKALFAVLVAELPAIRTDARMTWLHKPVDPSELQALLNERMDSV